MTGNAFLVDAGEMSIGVCCPEKRVWVWVRQKGYRIAYDVQGIVLDGGRQDAEDAAEAEDVRMQNEITASGKMERN